MAGGWAQPAGYCPPWLMGHQAGLGCPKLQELPLAPRALLLLGRGCPCAVGAWGVPASGSLLLYVVLVVGPSGGAAAGAPAGDQPHRWLWEMVTGLKLIFHPKGAALSRQDKEASWRKGGTLEPLSFLRVWRP